MEKVNLISIILAGITTGGLSCFAVQGGLLATAISNTKKGTSDSEASDEKIQALSATTAFIAAKFTVYVIAGAILGSFGSVWKGNVQIQAWIQIAVAIYMLGIAMQLLNVHPIFRYFILQPPAWMQRKIRQVAKGNSKYTTPILLGAMTIIIPCGTTLAMEALAISTGDPKLGALVMGTYTIASSWIFFAAGIAANFISQTIEKYFYKVTAATLILLGIISLNGGMNLLGSKYSFESLTAPKEKSKVLGATNNEKKVLADFDSVQRVTIDVRSSGYESDTVRLKKGIPVELTLITQNSYSCANAFTIPALNVQKVLPANGTEVIKFTPQKSGELAYSCSMGMYRGNFTVE